ncbi:MAG: hypothetical protein JXP34_07490 [Planctomycetes bacterium]|nr:hypothetical protein [Planctomycetota bacterium]
MNHYTIHIPSKDPDGKDEERSMRITHTWLREDGVWKVLGGMSASP